MANAVTNMNDIESYPRYAHLTYAEANLVMAIDTVAFLRLEVTRMHMIILALPNGAVYELAHFRDQLRVCNCRLRFWRRKARIANREWLNTIIGN